MIHTPVIPNRQIIHILPPVPDLKIMVIRHQSHEPVKQMLALSLCHIIDLLNVVPKSEDRFPAGNWVGADHGVNSFEDFSDVFGGSSRFGVDLESILLSRSVETGLGISCRERVKEFLVWG